MPQLKNEHEPNNNLMDSVREELAHFREEILDKLQTLSNRHTADVNRIDDLIVKLANAGHMSDMSAYNEISKQLNLLEKKLDASLDKVDNFLNTSQYKIAEYGEMAIFEEAMGVIRDVGNAIRGSMTLVGHQKALNDEIIQRMRHNEKYKGDFAIRDED